MSDPVADFPLVPLNLEWNEKTRKLCYFFRFLRFFGFRRHRPLQPQAAHGDRCAHGSLAHRGWTMAQHGSVGLIVAHERPSPLSVARRRSYRLVVAQHGSPPLGAARAPSCRVALERSCARAVLGMIRFSGISRVGKSEFSICAPWYFGVAARHSGAAERVQNEISRSPPWRPGRSAGERPRSSTGAGFERTRCLG